MSLWQQITNCLNPYYTGIDLHENILVNILDIPKSLNPYYTGIDLHVLEFENKTAFDRLNPYYTGIDLHTLIIRLLYILECICL